MPKLNQKEEDLRSMILGRGGITLEYFMKTYKVKNVRCLKDVKKRLNKKLKNLGLSKLPKVGSWDNFSANAQEEKDIKDSIDLQALQQKVLSLQKQNALLLKEAAYGKRLLEAVEKATPLFPPRRVVVPKIGRVKSIEHVGFLCSDVHASEHIGEETTGGFGSYSLETTSKMAEYLKSVIPDFLLSNLTGTQFDVFHFWFLGDMVSGIIHEELSKTNEMEVIELCFYLGQLFADLIMSLASVFPEVRVVGVPGNHGRLTKKTQYKLYYNNFDWAVYKLVGVLCSKMDNITFDFPKSFFASVRVYDHLFALIHGDGIKRHSGTPYYGLDRYFKKISALFASRRNYLKYLMLGHHHAGAMIPDVGASRKYVNGQWTGPSEYSLGAIMEGTDPTQLLFGIHKKKGVTWDLQVQLKYAVEDAA